MSFLEGLYIPRIDVKRLQAHLPREAVAQVLIDEYKCKGVRVNTSDIVAAAVELASIDQTETRDLLLNPSIRWHFELWPLTALRATQIYPPENDPADLHGIVLAVKKRFGKLAASLSNRPDIVENDIGFSLQPNRDKLPIICLRGKWSSHVLDGHHRAILAEWQERNTMDCLTAYRERR